MHMLGKQKSLLRNKEQDTCIGHPTEKVLDTFVKPIQEH